LTKKKKKRERKKGKLARARRANPGWDSYKHKEHVSTELSGGSWEFSGMTELSGRGRRTSGGLRRFWKGE
jgi:hypothetical protein